MKIGPPKFWGAKRPFFSEISDSVVFGRRCAETRGNSGKTEITGITTTSRLPAHAPLVKFGSTGGGHWSYTGLISCALFRQWPTALHYTGNISKTATRYRITSRICSQKAESTALSDGLALLGITAPVSYN